MKKLFSLLSALTITGTSMPSLVSCKIFDTNNEASYKQSTIIKQKNELLTSDEIRKRENRNLRHSEFKPTGYFLKKDSRYKIILNRRVTDDEAKNVKLSIGQWGKYANAMLQQDDNTFSEYQISSNSQEISFIAKNSGVLYVADNNQTNLQIVNVAGDNPEDVIKIPTFKVNETNEKEFEKETKTTNSPFVEFVSKHYFATMQTDIIKKIINGPKESGWWDAFLNNWDHGWNMTNKFWGLSEEATDINHKYSQYIHIANADDGAGYANATDGRVMFPNSTNAGDDLFHQTRDQGALWHESAHTYTAAQYTFSNTGETRAEVSKVYVQQSLRVKPKVFEFRDVVTKYLNQPDQDKHFLDMKEDYGDNTWTKVSMFWQLNMAFGNNFYTIVNQKYRKINNGQDPDADPRFDNDDKKVQGFIKLTSQVTGYNLAPFFTKWGLWVTDDTLNIIKDLKPLTKEIWNNIVDPSTEENPIVQEEI